jgi:hypothetical protein
LADVYNNSSKLPEWARLTLMGCIEVKRAWASRGGSWASKVTDEGWKGFAQHLKIAHDQLTASWKMRPDRPEAAAEMITVVMGDCVQGDDSLRLWFDRAVTAHFDYMPAYHHLQWALRPRWGGSHDQMLAFGRTCLATKRYDTYVPIYYLDVLNDISSELDDWRVLYKVPAIAAEVMALDKALLDEPTRKEQIPARLSHLALDSWLCGNFDESKKALDRLQWQVDAHINAKLSLYKIDKAAWLGEVVLHSDPAREDAEHANQAMNRQEYAEAASLYRAALGKCKNDYARQMVEGFAVVAALQGPYQKGEWVNITPKKSLAGWSIRSGDWEAGTDGALINHGNDARR